MPDHDTIMHPFQAANKLAELRRKASEYIRKLQLEKQAAGISSFEFTVTDVQLMVADLMKQG